MAAVEGSYKNLLQGMSQQPPQSRGDGQCELQVNMSADPVNDLSKRPASFNIKTFSLDVDPARYRFHQYDRGDNEEYLIYVGNGEVKVMGQDGTDYTVDGGISSYLNSTNEVEDISLTTVGDITLVTNSTVNTAMTSNLSTSVSQSTIDIKGGAWATVYAVSYENIATGATGIVEYRTPSGVGRTTDVNGNELVPIDPELDSEKLKPSSIATEIAALLNAQISGCATVEGNLIVLDTALVGIASATEGRSGTFINFAHDVIDSPDDLPKTSAVGRVIKIAPSGAGDDGDYFVKFEADNDYGEGLWKESVKPNVQYEIDSATMPHALVRLQRATGEIYFQFTPLDESTYTNFIDTYTVPRWSDRVVGDEDTNPIPSFIGNSITSMGLFQERLFFLSGEAIIFSTSDNYWDFFYTTALSVIDSDPIDFTASTGEVNVLKHGVLHDGDLLLFSDNAQFVVSGQRVLTPSAAGMVAITFFESRSKAKPLPSGRSVYFPVAYGEFNGLRELQTDAVSATRDAPPITSHVSKLIKGNVTKMSSSNEAGIMVLSTDTLDNKLYAYEYIWQGEQRVQSAWSYWEFDKDYRVIYHFNNKTVLFVVLHNQVTDQMFLAKVQLDDFLDNSFGFNVYLDNIVKLPVIGDNQVTLPFTHSDMMIVQGDNCPYPGMRAGVYTNLSYDGTSETVTLDTAMPGGTVIVGIPFTSQYRPTRPYIKDSKGTPITTGALTVSRFILAYRDSGYIEATLTGKYSGEVSGLLTGRILGEEENKVGVAPIVSGTVNIPVLQDPGNAYITITSNDYRPIILTDLEWEGQFSKNKRRI